MERENRHKTNQSAVSRMFGAPLAQNVECFIFVFEDQLRERILSQITKICMGLCQLISWLQ